MKLGCYKHPLFNAFDSIADIVPVSSHYKVVFSTYRPIEDITNVHLNLIVDSTTILTKTMFLEDINLQIHALNMFKRRSNE